MRLPGRFAWLLRVLGRRPRPAADDEETLWAVWLVPNGEDERLVAVIAGTRGEALDAGMIAGGAYAMMTGEVFIGRYATQELFVSNEFLLKTTLELAVPLWIAQLKTRPWAELTARAAAAGQIVAEKGDVLQFKGKKKGESAKAFNALAEGVAILAFSPGGVKLFGLHFEAKHEGAA